MLRLVHRTAAATTTRVRSYARMSAPISLDYTQDRASDLRESIAAVQQDVDNAAGTSAKPRLVAVSKLKPASDIKALYDAGYRHFGENYIQEMVDKAAVLPEDIKWHFIGSLQSNKSKLAASVPNLFILETLSSTKVADLLQKSLPPSRQSKLNVYLQVNTSGEDSKSGLSPLPSNSAELVDLAVHVIEKCPGLKLLGIMTIGSWDASHDPTKPNPDFECLKRTRAELAKALAEKGVQGAPKEDELELSMGMSADFVQAIKEGSSSVRVGTRIFGERPKKK
ncbi:YggS family pyridoxal phosphate enzyme [Cryptococcus neoformans C23]|uniref:Pyridoxal phosphate homeostasis protein n=2 Tax=Cryptococcus neoformans TaxID=5207 RepID=A0A854QCL8_CRYNE|nr:YggS family pyridoxal phosphate enzyme [Cryptococcus neoformans var. grubii AD2-60a]OWZ35556.1 YggS family pyridoxal phosphate enzyme [Cryptococcus neoformans var. grubii AD1-83a]OWZ41302.1 YggS family pyridoxal phosphate enzyme [Cryptococcus neoformans var. grubii C23]OWZ52372.1 YggS family pyridoxal phosphate enzyme [Cryptococcus neoformans var. grubii 125.91]OXC82742.1 YggS family pyridoxal phosphate enzyme [Cryptococcus neoformans var. grubii AD1-7a]OXG16031.1 YggS family pyridoxal phos